MKGICNPISWKEAYSIFIAGHTLQYVCMHCQIKVKLCSVMCMHIAQQIKNSLLCITLWHVSKQTCYHELRDQI